MPNQYTSPQTLEAKVKHILSKCDDIDGCKIPKPGTVGFSLSNKYNQNSPVKCTFLGEWRLCHHLVWEFHGNSGKVYHTCSRANCCEIGHMRHKPPASMRTEFRIRKISKNLVRTKRTPVMPSGMKILKMIKK